MLSFVYHGFDRLLMSGFIFQLWLVDTSLYPKSGRCVMTRRSVTEGYISSNRHVRRVNTMFACIMYHCIYKHFLILYLCCW